MNFEIDEQQRDFAASIDAALGAADVPVRAWRPGTPTRGGGVSQLTDLGVTALLVAEKYDGIDAHPVDLRSRPSGWATGRARSGHRVDRRRPDPLADDESARGPGVR